MTDSDNRRPDGVRRARGGPAFGAALVGGISIFLVLVGVVASRAATDLLRTGDLLAVGPVARQVSTATAPARSRATVAGAATPGRPPVPSATTVRGRALIASPGGGTRPGAASQSAAAGTAKAAGVGGAVRAAPAGGVAYLQPSVVGTAVTGCRVNPGGDGVVTYTVAFQGGAAWTPGANFTQGAYTVNVVGGHGAHSGLDAVINGAPIWDQADSVETYVLFPPGMVLDARC